MDVAQQLALTIATITALFSTLWLVAYLARDDWRTWNLTLATRKRYVWRRFCGDLTSMNGAGVIIIILPGLAHSLEGCVWKRRPLYKRGKRGGVGGTQYHYFWTQWLVFFCLFFILIFQQITFAWASSVPKNPLPLPKDLFLNISPPLSHFAAYVHLTGIFYSNSKEGQ